MAIKVVTDFRILLILARDLARAESTNDSTKIDRARKAHDSYRDLMLNSDEVRLDLTRGDL